MNSAPIDKKSIRSVHRENGKTPVFFDFSQGSTPEEYMHPQVFREILNQTSDLVDGIIMLPRGIPDDEILKGKDVWARSDWTSAFSPTIPGIEESIIPVLNPGYWDLEAVSSIVGTLILGNSSVHEADNIQYLASQRSYCFDIGLPLAIDLHVLGEDEEGEFYGDIIELGLSLAVELGSDMVILPGGEYLASNGNIQKIAELPILARFSLKKPVFKEWPSEKWRRFLEQVDGIVLMDILHWTENLIDRQIFQKM